MKKRQQSRLRQMMRGYRILKQTSRLNLIEIVKQALTEHNLNQNNQTISSFVIGSGAGLGEIVIRQYLLVRVGDIKLNRALLLSLAKDNKRVIFPLPKEWRKILMQYDFKVAHFRSALLWQLYVVIFLLYGIIKIGAITFAGITSGKKTVLYQKRYAYFANLGIDNLPKKINSGESYNIISWYLQWIGRASDLEVIHHGVTKALPTVVGGIPISPRQAPLPELVGIQSIVRYFFWGLGASLIAVLHCLHGRWWYALLLNQAAIAAQVRNLPAGLLAQDYLFNISGWIYRPLWTYEAEQLGSAITFYFYSTNSESFKKQNGYPPINHGWKAMSWPHYLVWDKYQADFVRQAVGNYANISIVGSIWFQGGVVEVPKINNPSIAVFDVQPVRSSRYRILGMDLEYYIPEISIRFLSDILESISKMDGNMILKRKRKIGKLAHPKYRNFLNKLDLHPHFHTIDSEISAYALCEKCSLVISMPFTSTALIAEGLGKPSIYYDPSGIIQKDDRAAHGIPIISGQKELKNWLEANICNQNRIN